MSDLQVLYLILLVLYLGECLWLLHRSSVAFVPYFPGRCRPVLPGPTFGHRSSGLVLDGPLPAFGWSFAAHPLPVSVDEEAVLASIPQALTAAGAPPQSAELVELDQIGRVACSERTVTLDGRDFLVCASRRAALRLARLLDELRRLPRPERLRHLEACLAASFDEAGARCRLALLEEQGGAWLRWLCTLLLAHLFLVAPVAILSWGFKRSLALLVAILVGLVLAVAVHFFRLHRRLLPELGAQRVEALVTMLLFPPAAVRAASTLSRELLSDFDPLVLAAVLGTRQDLERLARTVVLDLRHPLLTTPGDERRRAMEVNQARRLLAQVEALLARHEVDCAQLTAPPAEAGQAGATYCPRCLVAFRNARPACPDCGTATRPGPAAD